jgi:WhiB family redox-sensing transcriptional regulator
MNVLAEAAPPLAGIVTANRLIAAKLAETGVAEGARWHHRERRHARRQAVNLPCQHHNPDLWFSDSPADIDTAKALCTGCPLQRACLLGALERGEYAGVWGGELLDRGMILRHKRGPGRPRKNSETPRRYHVAAVEAQAV